VGILLGLGVFLACAILSFVAAFIAAALGAQPGERDPEAMQEWAGLVASTLPAGENGWRRLRDAQQEWRAIDREMALRHDTVRALHHASDRLLMDSWDHPEHEIPRLIWVEVEARVMPLIHAAAAKPALLDSDVEYIDAQTIGDSICLLQHFQMWRVINRARELTITTMRAACVRGDWVEFERCFETAFRLSRHALAIGGRFGLHTHHTGLASTLDQLQLLDREHRLPAEVRDRMLEAIEREMATAPDMALAAEIERCRGLAELPQRFGPTGHRLTFGDGKSKWRTGLRQFNVLWMPNRDEYMAEREASLRAAVEWVDDLTQSWSMSVHATSERMISIARTDAHSMVQTFAHRAVALAASRATFAASAFQSRNGRWPRTLDEAMPHEWTLNPLTGAPFRYITPAPEQPGAFVFEGAPAPDGFSGRQWYFWWEMVTHERPRLRDPWPANLSEGW